MARATAAPLSRGKKLLFASMTVVTFWVGLEALCAVLGVRPVASHADPFVGFSETVPLTVAVTGDDGRRVRVTAPGKRVWFNDQAFPERKPEGTFRIICVGGSTTFGRPYDDATSFCGWLREMLPAVDPTRRWEVINAGEHDAAANEFRTAIDEDVCPLRAITEITQAIRDVGRQSSLGVVDFEDLLRREGIRRNGHPCLGDEFFLDHVHPNVEVHGWLATWILDHLQAARIVGGRPLRFDRSDPIWDSVSERVQARLTPEYVAVAMRNLAKVFHWAGKFEEAETYARRGLEVLPEDPESRFVLADCLTNLGRPHAALEEYGRLYPTVDRFPRGYLPYAELLKHVGDYQQAKAFATLAIAYRPENAYRYRLLGEIHLALAEWELAAESLTLADRLRPDDPETWLRLAEAHLGSGDTQAAIRRYRQVVAIRPDDPTARYRLAMALLKSSEAAAAAEQLRLVLRQDPEHPLANAALRAVDASHPAAGSAAPARDSPAATAPTSP